MKHTSAKGAQALNHCGSVCSHMPETQSDEVKNMKESGFSGSGLEDSRIQDESSAADGGRMRRFPLFGPVAHGIGFLGSLRILGLA